LLQLFLKVWLYDYIVESRDEVNCAVLFSNREGETKFS